jgi:hypothetical protein
MAPILFAATSSTCLRCWWETDKRLLSDSKRPQKKALLFPVRAAPYLGVLAAKHAWLSLLQVAPENVSRMDVFEHSGNSSGLSAEMP